MFRNNQPKLIMIKKLILLLSIFLFTYSYSQVGIETSFPKGALHIDGNKDNPKDATSTISNVQQSNDFIISQTNGNVGIGTTSPTTKLEINNGTTNGAIKITDGTEGVGKYLMSDNSGLAKWIKPNSFKSAIIWTYNGTPQQIVTSPENVNSNGEYLSNGSNLYTNLSLTGLTTGKWIVNMGIRLSTSKTIANAFWLHGKISSSNSSQSYVGWKNLGPAGNATGYASVIYGDGTANGKGFFTGTTIIEVTSTSPISLYLLLENLATWQFDTSSPENYFYAIPIN